MRIFLCYPHEHRRVAEGMRLALEQEGHEVFFDRANLTPGEEYVAAIRRQVEAADLFVFCLSPESVQPGRFVLTELDLAEKKWRRPHQHVLPVLVAPVPVDLVPPFLTAVGILEPRGDIPAEVANHVAGLSNRWRKAPLRSRYRHWPRCAGSPYGGRSLIRRLAGWLDPPAHRHHRNVEHPAVGRHRRSPITVSPRS